MTDSEFHTLCVMAATIRAGKAGKKAEAWRDAVEEAVSGYAMLAGNREALSRLTALSGEALDEAGKQSVAESN